MGADPPATYRTRGKELVGDVDADGAGDRVTLRVDERRPGRCRHLLVVEVTAERTAIARVPPLSWPGTDPQLLLLVEVDGRPGLEPVVALSPRAVYRTAGTRFELVREEGFQVEVGPEARQRWPEVRGDPFLSCSQRVG